MKYLLSLVFVVCGLLQAQTSIILNNNLNEPIDELYIQGSPGGSSSTNLLNFPLNPGFIFHSGDFADGSWDIHFVTRSGDTWSWFNYNFSAPTPYVLTLHASNFPEFLEGPTQPQDKEDEGCVAHTKTSLSIFFLVGVLLSLSLLRLYNDPENQKEKEERQEV